MGFVAFRIIATSGQKLERFDSIRHVQCIMWSMPETASTSEVDSAGPPVPDHGAELLVFEVCAVNNCYRCYWVKWGMFFIHQLGLDLQARRSSSRWHPSSFWSMRKTTRTRPRMKKMKKNLSKRSSENWQLFVGTAVDRSLSLVPNVVPKAISIFFRGSPFMVDMKHGQPSIEPSLGKGHAETHALTNGNRRFQSFRYQIVTKHSKPL